MKLERHHPPTRREAWTRIGQFCSVAALWSSDRPMHFMSTKTPQTSALAVPWASSPSDEFTLITQLGKSRIGTITDASWLSQQPWVRTNQQPIYFPQFLFGAWNVTATFRHQFQVPPCDEAGASVDKEDRDPRMFEATYQMQFFATLANTWENQLAVNLGTGIPETKVIANRAYNLPAELSRIGWSSNEFSDIHWEYRSASAPSLVSWEDLDHHLYERDVLECLSESSTQGEKVFAATERHRIQALSSNSASHGRKVIKLDTETTTEYHQITDNHVQAISRTVLFPSAIPAFRFEGTFCPTSITVLDYDLSMHRLVQPFQNVLNDTVEERPCVETPNGIVQCY
jgi:hypothetical protein